MFVSPFKKINSVKKKFTLRNNTFCLNTHSVKNEFYFQFSFAANEQV